MATPAPRNMSGASSGRGDSSEAMKKASPWGLAFKIRWILSCHNKREVPGQAGHDNSLLLRGDEFQTTPMSGQGFLRNLALGFFLRKILTTWLGFRFDKLKPTHVRTEDFRNLERAVFLLVVVADADHHARSGEARAVKRVEVDVLAAYLRLDVG